MTTYAMSVFLLPPGLCIDMEKLMSKFWWKSSSSHWRSWGKMVIHKSVGGLDFRTLHEFN